jgi:HlyD family secretion protein
LRSRPLAAALVLALVLVACSDDDGPVTETAEVRAGEVVQTVAAPARLAAAEVATAVAPFGARVEAVMVSDGQRVQAGDPLIRLASDPIDARIDQAEQTLASAQELGELSIGGGFDLAPTLGAFRTQLDDVVPGLVGGLESQLASAQGALNAAIAGVSATADAAEEFRRNLEAAVDGIAPEVIAGAEDLADLEAVEGVDQEAVAELEALLDQAPPSVVDLDGVLAGLLDAQASTVQAQAQLRETRVAFASASTQLAEVEADLAATTEATEQAQAEAVEAQVQQAQAAVDAARDQLDDRTVLAPIAGTVELIRDRTGGGGAAGDLGGLLDGGLEGLAGGLGGLGDLAGGLGDVEGPGGDGSAGGGVPGSAGEGMRSGPVQVGVQVGAGESLVRLYDLSGFTAELDIDELDVVELAVDQPVELAVDAFPGVVLTGRIDRIAIAPSRDVTGGSLYPVSVALDALPADPSREDADLPLRVGLTASAEIEVRRVEGDTVVPTSALLRRGGGEVVYVVRDGIAVEVPVVIAAIGDLDAAVTGDIEVGDVVVTTGVELVADGDELPDV